MAEILGEITLDLDRDVLEGFERWKSAGIVKNYVEKSLRGEQPPLVEVVKINGIYQIVHGARENCVEDDNYNYGGHHRSVSSYISGKKLECLLLNEHWSSFKRDFFPIKNIHLYDFDTEEIKEFLKKVPSDVFCKFVNMCRYRSPKLFGNNEMKDNLLRKTLFKFRLGRWR